MSITTSAVSKQELLAALYGEVTMKELEESNLGVTTPVRANEKVTITPLLPPKTQGRVSSVLKRFRSTRNTGGLLFVEKVVAVFTPHVPDNVLGEVEIWLHDNILPDLGSVGKKLRLKLSAGPQLLAFYPSYSIALGDSISTQPRSFSIVTELLEGNFAAGCSPFSLYLMWSPRIEAVAHNYLPRDPRVLAICRTKVKDALMEVSSQQEYLKGAMSNRFAMPVIRGDSQDDETGRR
uniref:Putative cell-to-cell movement protein n=1 Tax=Red clover umbravirus TaxID=2301725 RepID=A0A6M6A915_9TOMB|nr:putative cell-to-cell movement protein [Red clover umbravirus]